MAQQVQELIDKIKQEGFTAAQQESQKIEAEAHQKAKDIIDQAQKKSKEILDKAAREAQKFEETSKATVEQAARDTLLSLKKDIQKMLHRIVVKNIQEALSPQALADMILAVVKDFAKGHVHPQIQVVLSPQNLSRLEDGLIVQLQQDLKKEIHFEARDDMGQGLMISFDQGKSIFDFSDQSLAEYVSGYLNEQLSHLITER